MADEEMNDMKCQVRSKVLKLTVDEDLTIESAGHRLEEFKGALQKKNFTEVVFTIAPGIHIDSRGIGLLVGFYKECLKMGVGYKMVVQSKDHFELFRMLSLTSIMNIERK